MKTHWRPAIPACPCAYSVQYTEVRLQTPYLFLRTVSRAVTAPCGVTVSTVGGCLPWSPQLARLLQTRSVLIATRKTNTIVTVVAEARFLNTVRLHRPYHGIGPGQRLPVVHFAPLEHVHPCSLHRGLALDIIIALIPALAYEHRAARYPSHIHIDTTGTWSKYPGRPWRESFWRSSNGHHQAHSRLSEAELLAD
jgi:hypothetical protein